MIKSMTGFGQGSAEGDDFRVGVDIRSVNNRALDIHTRLPQELSSLEVTLKKQVQAALKRGRVIFIPSLRYRLIVLICQLGIPVLLGSFIQRWVKRNAGER